MSKVLCESTLLEASNKAAAEEQRTPASDSQSPGSQLGASIDGMLQAIQGSNTAKKSIDEYFTSHAEEKAAIRQILDLSKSRRGKVAAVAVAKASTVCPQKFQNQMVTATAMLTLFRSASE